MYPILFSIGSVNFYTHGVAIALGAFLGGLVIFYLAKKEGLSRKNLFDLLVYSLFLGIIGARIVYLIFYYYQFPNWKEMLLIWYGGLVSFGGIIGGFLAAGLILRKRGENILKWFDIGIIGLYVGWIFGKIGCLLSGDTLGIISQSKIAIWGQIPVALFEPIWAGLLIIGLYLLLVQKRWQLKNGFIFLVGLAGYALGRFVIDFWRVGRIIILHLKSSQLASLGIILICLIIIYIYYVRSPKGVESV